ncbi:hypothetical protein JHK85_012058 [Glycine max]|nr:hypothetical protein JHK85_012058 [Glycine max]
MQRLVGELSPAAGLNFSDGYQATAVVKAVANGGTFLTYGKKLPQHIVFEEDGRKRVEWTAFLKEKNLKLKALGIPVFSEYELVSSVLRPDGILPNRS